MSHEHLLPGSCHMTQETGKPSGVSFIRVFKTCSYTRGPTANYQDIGMRTLSWVRWGINIQLIATNHFAHSFIKLNNLRLKHFIKKYPKLFMIFPSNSHDFFFSSVFDIFIDNVLDLHI